MQKAIVLNYPTQSVGVVDIPDDIADQMEVEEYISNNYGYHLDECHYMAVGDNSIEVFYNNETQPYTTL